MSIVTSLLYNLNLCWSVFISLISFNLCFSLLCDDLLGRWKLWIILFSLSKFALIMRHVKRGANRMVASFLGQWASWSFGLRALVICIKIAGREEWDSGTGGSGVHGLSCIVLTLVSSTFNTTLDCWIVPHFTQVVLFVNFSDLVACSDSIL